MASSGFTGSTNTHFVDETEIAWRAKRVIDGDPSFEDRLRAALAASQDKPRRHRWFDRSSDTHVSTHRPIGGPDLDRAKQRSARRTRRDRVDRLVFRLELAQA